VTEPMPSNTQTIVDLSRRRLVHVVGIGGSGMSAIAVLLDDLGHTVTGSDQRASRVTEQLMRRGITVRIGHAASNIGSPELVACSTAVSPSNPEVVEASRRNIPIARRADALRAIAQQANRTIAITGTHGKGTTSALLKLALEGSGLQPSFLVGGELPGVGIGAGWRDPGLFVVEADESDGSAFELPAFGLIVTNIEPDHLDHWGTFDALRDAFVDCALRAGGPVVACADDVEAARLARFVPNAITYGRSPSAHFVIVDEHAGPEGTRFRLRARGCEVDVQVPLPGAHVVLDAAGALAMASALSADLARAAAALSSYEGIARRFEHRGSAGGVTFVDDYAHLPAEVAANVAAARGLVAAPALLVVVFQPHRYTRTATIGPQFATAFGGADVVVIAGIYAAGEQPLPGITAGLIADAVQATDTNLPVLLVESRERLAEQVAALLRPGDLVLTLGAGDITTLADELQSRLRGERAS